jgi:predicted 3-demethylubiquinone-9 3-methyltransferase (glyoxalase superfamily)
MPIRQAQGKNKIATHLWFDKEAVQAAQFYTSVFPDAKVTSSSQLHDTPSGDVDMVSFTIAEHDFMAISAGPLFKFTPAISFIVNFDPSKMPDARERLDQIWNKLIDGGEALMPLQQYPFSEHYGWLKDKYGLSWQLMLANPEGEERPFITPSLMFVREKVGRAEEAINFYLSVFKNSKKGMLARYPAGAEGGAEGNLMYGDFMLEGAWFAAMDSAGEHNFDFNEAISILVHCKDQAEIDYYWEKLSAVPESEQCGWLKDRYGVSWQIVPEAMEEMMKNGNPEQLKRVTESFLKMKKFDLAELERAYEGTG